MDNHRAPLTPAAKEGGNKRTVDVRAVVNGVMYLLSTRCQWAALPKGLPAKGDQGLWVTPSTWLAGDFNGDGKTDLAYIFSTDGNASIDAHLSNGHGFTGHHWATDQGGWMDLTITDPPHTPRFGVSCAKQNLSTTLEYGLSPMRVPP